MKIVLIHGFNVRDAGAGSIDKLAPAFEKEGWTVDKDDADYGFHFLFKVRFPFMRKGVLKRIQKAIVDADVIVTHSNGANYLFQAMKKAEMPKKKLVIAIAPALNRKVKIPEAIRKIYVLHSDNDIWTSLSRVLLFHPWGAAGKKGLKTNDIRAINIEKPDRGHSNWFKDGKLLRSTKEICVRLIRKNHEDFNISAISNIG